MNFSDPGVCLMEMYLVLWRKFEVGGCRRGAVIAGGVIPGAAIPGYRSF
jgi:hypothetical protein